MVHGTIVINNIRLVTLAEHGFRPLLSMANKNKLKQNEWGEENYITAKELLLKI